jgi:hypothetical protein
VAFPHPGVLGEPREAPISDLGRVLAGEQELEKGDPPLRIGLGGSRRSH